MAKDLSLIFERKPRQWGLRGDPYLWDDMHKRKIDMADSIYVINVGGYIGDSTRSEIEYAV